MAERDYFKEYEANGTVYDVAGVGLVDAHDSSVKKVWTGTKAEYEALGKYFAYSYNSSTVYTRTTTLTESTQLYSGVDTLSELTIEEVSGQTMVLSDGFTYVRARVNDLMDTSKYDSNTYYEVTDDVDVTLPMLEMLYPVGSIYLTVNSVCPLSAILGTWQLVSNDRVLQGAGTRGSAGSTVDESLPNIKGRTATYVALSYAGDSGALSHTDAVVGSAASAFSPGINNLLSFNASRSSSTYQDNAPVQQDAYLLNVFQRIA